MINLPELRERFRVNASGCDMVGAAACWSARQSARPTGSFSSTFLNCYSIKPGITEWKGESGISADSGEVTVAVAGESLIINFW